MNCKNCNTEVLSTYCPTCGVPAKLQRIDGRYIQHEIEQVLEIERGFFYTIKELTIHPGQTVKTYLTENRSRLVKPIIFIIITSLIYTLLDHYLQIEDGYVQYGIEKETATGVIIKWVQDHYGYANIIMGVFISLWVKLLFRKYDYNFFEILILLCFVMGMGMLIFSVFVILQGLTHVNFMTIGGHRRYWICRVGHRTVFRPVSKDELRQGAGLLYDRHGCVLAHSISDRHHH